MDYAEERELSFLARDGVRLVGTLYVPDRERPAGLILVHDRDRSRIEFQSFAHHARREGYMSLAFDRRGHGDSGAPSGSALDRAEGQVPDRPHVLDDIAAAKKTLIDAGADAENLAIVGAGSGANLALAYAAGDGGIQAAVLLSPVRIDEGISAVDAGKRYGRRPLMLLASANDTAGVTTCKALRELAPGYCEFREYDGTARGTHIFDAATTSSGQVLLWLSGIIGPEAAQRNREFQAETGNAEP